MITIKPSLKELIMNMINHIHPDMTYMNDFLIANLQAIQNQPGNLAEGRQATNPRGLCSTYCVQFALNCLIAAGYEIERDLGDLTQHLPYTQNIFSVDLFRQIAYRYSQLKPIKVLGFEDAKFYARQGMMITIHSKWTPTSGHVALSYGDPSPTWKNEPHIVVSAGAKNQLNYEELCYNIDTASGFLIWMWRPGKRMKEMSARRYKRLMAYYNYWIGK